MGNSLFAIFSSFLGDSYYTAMMGNNPGEPTLSRGDKADQNSMGLAFFFLFVSFVLTLVLSNVFIGNVYDECHEK